MKQFIAFVKKEFFHIFRDRRTMLILLGMPVVQIILFGFAITTEVKNVRVGVLDPSNDMVTRRIIDRLDASEYFSVKCLLHSPQEMERVFQENEIDMALVFSEQFADRLYTGDARVQLVSDATDPNMATTQAGYATGVIAAVRQEMLPPGMSVPSVVPNVKLLYNPQMKSAYNFVPGVMGLILMLICAMMTSISIVREKETGTMEILLVSPVKPLFIILAKAVPYFVLSFVNLTTILLLSVYVLDVPVAGSLFWLIMVSLLFIFVSLSLGLLISTVTRTQVAAMLASGLVLMMPTMLLSGMTDTAQVDENSSLADLALPNSMTANQLDTIARVLMEFEKSNRVPCTGCGYCMPCPKGINIPGCFAAYNASYAHSWFTGLSQYFTASAVRTSEPKLVSNCVKCGKCARHCPQHIDIPERLDDVRRRFQPGPVTAVLKAFGKTRSS